MMKSIFRGLEIERRENAIKESLKSQLMVSIKEVQLVYSMCMHEAQTQSESTGGLCAVLEAIFIHGLKESFVDRVLSISDQTPQPDFWSPIMVLSHRDIIKQINKMSQITTDVGRCRAWIRLALNDGLLPSYFEIISNETKSLGSYYRKYAFLRDKEMIGFSLSLIGGLSSVSFGLPTNSSILNVWTNRPLVMAGYYTGTLKSCPVESASEAVKAFPDVEEVHGIPEETASLISFTPSYSSRLLLDEEEALKIILGTPIEGSPLQSHMNLDQMTDASVLSSAANKLKEISDVEERQESKLKKNENKPSPSEVLPVDNILPEQSVDKESEVKEETKKERKKKEVELEENKTVHTIDTTYQSLLKNYNAASRSLQNQENLEEVIKRFSSTTPLETSFTTSIDSGDEQVTQMGFEVISESQTISIKAPEFRSIIEQLGKIMQEPGLDSQNYACCLCRQPIGITFTEAKVCSLSGWYYCTECFMSSEAVIPGRVIHNWDFGKYEVSGRVALLLQEIQHHPLLDIRKINPRLYIAVHDMALLQKLRLKLNLLRGYLVTCRQPIIKDLRKQVWPREYLFEHVHLYSLSDLLEVSSGALYQFLNKLVKLCEEHVIACSLCSQKGFICEICQHEKVIYPFDLDNSYRCLFCKSVYHLKCRKEECRKCERLRKRQEDISALTSINLIESSYS